MGLVWWFRVWSIGLVFVICVGVWSMFFFGFIWDVVFGFFVLGYVREVYGDVLLECG